MSSKTTTTTLTEDPTLLKRQSFFKIAINPHEPPTPPSKTVTVFKDKAPKKPQHKSHCCMPRKM